MKILLSSASGIGDFIFLLPVTMALKEKYHKISIDVLVRGTQNNLNLYKEILEYVDKKSIDNIYYYNSKELFHNIKLITQLKLKNYDYGLILRYKNQPFSPWPYRILKISGCKIIALKGYLLNGMRADCYVNVDSEQKHNVDAYFEVLQYFNINKADINKYYFNIFNRTKLEARYNQLRRRKNSEVLILCMGANNVKRKVESKYIENNVKNWPVERWITLANRLVLENKDVILIGGTKEKKELENVKTNLDDKIINLVGKTNIGDSIAVLSGADLVVGCDTGIMHCASALNKKTLMLLGAVCPKQAQGYGKNGHSIYLQKDCSPCYGTDRDLMCKKPVCMLDISVEMVLDKIRMLLS